MAVGQRWPSETTVFEDQRSGVTMRRLTNQPCHSHHLYFTNPGWFDGGRRLLFGSHRSGVANLFSVGLADGAITQLTDFAQPLNAQNAYVNPTRDEAYVWSRGELLVIDLHTGLWRVLFRAPEGFRPGNLSVTADGRSVCTLVMEDQSIEGSGAVIQRLYHKFRERMEARPLSRIMRIGIDGGETAVVHEDRCLLGHINTSPTQPELLTFCHEGPWHLVDHRIWALNHETAQTTRLRPRDADGERIGHEYWYADGIHVGYHGTRTDGTKFFGRVRYDNTDAVEVAFPHPIGHVHSNDLNLIVADGGSTVKLWQWNGSGFDGPRVLCEHWCAPFVQICHVHPRFNADGTQVVFTSNTGGYGNVYLADVPASFEDLPELAEGES